MDKVLSVKPSPRRGGLRFEARMRGPEDKDGRFNFQLLIRDKKTHPALMVGLSWRKQRYALFRNWTYQSLDLYDLTVPEQLEQARELVAQVYANDRIEVSVNYTSPGGGDLEPFKAELPYRRKVERLHRYLEKAVADGLPQPKPGRLGPRRNRR